MTKFERQRRSLLVTIVVLSLILTTLCGYAQAKYVTTETLEGTVTITVDIGSIEIHEHQALRQADGSYKLLGVGADGKCDGTEHGHSTYNSYTLIPGLDVPKDPYVVITKENDIPVYVYVEVVDELGANSGITYSIASSWNELSGVTGLNGGKVYYQEITHTSTLYILEKNTIYVSQKLDQSLSDLNLTFYASMKQVVDSKTPAQIYTDSDNY